MNTLAVNLAVEAAIDYAQLTATKVGDHIIDMAGHYQLVFLIHVHAIGTLTAAHYFTPVVYEGDNSALSDGVAITNAARIVATDVLDDDTTAEDVIKVEVTLGTKRYMRLHLVETDTADVTLSAVAVKGDARVLPTS
jgi:hypothetical protein